MSGKENFNYDAFNEAARGMRDKGWEVVNPAESHGGRQDLPREEYFRTDIPQLITCDAILLLEGWEDSEGARLEFAVARACGIRALAFPQRMSSALLGDDFPQVRLTIDDSEGPMLPGTAAIARWPREEREAKQCDPKIHDMGLTRGELAEAYPDFDDADFGEWIAGQTCVGCPGCGKLVYYHSDIDKYRRGRERERVGAYPQEGTQAPQRLAAGNVFERQWAYDQVGADAAKEDAAMQPFRDILEEVYTLHAGKRKDYTGGEHPLANYKFAGECIGVDTRTAMLQRMGEKFFRLRSLYLSGDGPVNESVRDTYLDIAIIAMLSILSMDPESGYGD